MLVTRNGQKNVFQLERNVLIAMTASTVFESGRMMRTKMPSWLQPSSLADSMSGVGMLVKNCLARKMLYDVTTPGRIMAAKVFVMCSLFAMRM